MAKTALMDLWRGMLKRCNDPKHISYRYYGAKGIRVCERWADFATFVADMPPRPPGATLDRIDSKGNYEPANCRWATVAEQNRNRSNSVLVEIGGETKTMGAWAALRGLSPQAVHHRVRKLGMSPVAALAMPASRQTRHSIDWAAIKKDIK